MHDHAFYFISTFNQRENSPTTLNQTTIKCDLQLSLKISKTNTIRHIYLQLQ